MDPVDFPASHAVVRDLDSIQQSAAASRARRHEAVKKATAVIQGEADRFLKRAISRAQYPFRAQTYQAIESLIDQLRPAAPAHSARLRSSMHRVLAEFYDGRKPAPIPVSVRA